MLKNKRVFLLFFLAIIVFFSFLAPKAMASESDVLGTQIVENDINLESTNPRTVVVKVINIALGLLGIIAVCIVIFAGFKWMTSNGDEEKISEAKKMLKNGVIGLAIILASWGIVTFIFKSLIDDETSNGSLNAQNILARTGLGAIGNCSIESVYPEANQKEVARNTAIMITFKEAINPSSFNDSSVIICKQDDFDFDNNTCSSTVAFNPPSFTGGNTIAIINPTNYLGNEDNYSNYVVYLSDSIKKANGSDSVFSSCSYSFFLWGFEVSNYLDLTPPTIKSVFPSVDNSADSITVTNNLVTASASIKILSAPNYFQSAKVVSVITNTGNSTTTASINSYYNGDYTDFKIIIAADNKAQLVGGNNNTSLGIFDIMDNQVNFTNYFILNFPSGYEAGNSWNIKVSPRKLADTLTIGNYVYTFVAGDTTGGYNIAVGSSFDSNVLASSIKTALELSNNPDVIIDNSNTENSTVALKAKVSGSGGNNIQLSSSNSEAISIIAFNGGADKTENTIINGKEDQPMNSIVQINFSEVINPSTVVGDSDEMKNIIRVVNNSATAVGAGATCSENKDCRSYNCTGGSCVGDSIAGSFAISSNYKIVEFKSNNKCGVNGCGEDIFCLPASSNLKIEIQAASLATCSSDTDCSGKSSFTTCSTSCTDGNFHYYPLADINLETGLNGVIDAANNSLDGNSDSYAQGPISFFNKNDNNISSGDNFKWSFWVSNKIDATPPKIKAIIPALDATSSVSLIDDVVITFNKLMMSSTLKTGQVIVNDVTHRLLNLISGQLVGYWIDSENEDSDPLDGIIDQTTAYIKHAIFFEGADYTSQVGSGVKDIYQNCFKPSGGSSGSIICTPDSAQPFCCNGVAKNSCE